MHNVSDYFSPCYFWFLMFHLILAIQEKGLISRQSQQSAVRGQLCQHLNTSNIRRQNCIKLTNRTWETWQRSLCLMCLENLWTHQLLETLFPRVCQVTLMGLDKLELPWGWVQQWLSVLKDFLHQFFPATHQSYTWNTAEWIFLS